MADEEEKDDVTEEELPETEDEAVEEEASEDEAPEADAEDTDDESDEEEEPEPTPIPEHTTSEAPRDEHGAVVVRASARYVRSAPRKARLVMDHIRGKRVDDARALLSNTPRAASRDVLKLLNSAVANAENNHELDPGDLKVHRATVDEGPTIKRYRPRAQGRATPINKRTSHMTISLTTTGEDS